MRRFTLEDDGDISEELAYARAGKVIAFQYTGHEDVTIDSILLSYVEAE